MIQWITIALISILVLFVIFAFARELIYKKFKLKICSICAAVSLTWITIIILKTIGIEIDNLLPGILMGESITGIMYLFENKAKEKSQNNILWLKVVIILLGTLLVYLFLTKGLSLEFIITLIISIILAIVINIKLNKKKKNKSIPKEHGKFKNEIEKLEERFEHCCD